MAATTREIRLASRPEGMPAESNFELVESPIPAPAEGEVLVRNSYLSVDPYMRGRMRDTKSYVPPFAVGEVLQGGAVGQVIASNGGPFEEGSWVLSMLGWREHYVSDGEGLIPVDPQTAPVSAALGVLGMPGLTAYVGLSEIARAHPGETVFVSAAAGAVGSVAGQLARIGGCRVVGSAGSAEKVALLTEDLGFHAAFNYKERPVAEALREHCPGGIDVYFDNVGGDHLDAALSRMNTFGRIALCGSISDYNQEEPSPGPRNFARLVPRRLTLRGFIVLDHYGLYPQFAQEVGAHIKSGELSYRETVLDGIESMPAAFLGLLGGANVGKMLVRVGPDAA